MKTKSKTILHLFLLVSLLSMLSATLFTSYMFYQEYQVRQDYLCSDVTANLRQIRTDALSDNSQVYLRYKAIKLIATMYAEIRTGIPLAKLSPDIVGMEMNDLNYMCTAYPDYKIGEIVRYNSEKYLKERSRFNREFSNMLGWQKVEQDYLISEIGRWLSTESKK